MFLLEFPPRLLAVFPLRPANRRSLGSPTISFYTRLISQSKPSGNVCGQLQFNCQFILFFLSVLRVSKEISAVRGAENCWTTFDDSSKKNLRKAFWAVELKPKAVWQHICMWWSQPPDVPIQTYFVFLTYMYFTAEVLLFLSFSSNFLDFVFWLNSNVSDVYI